MATQNLAAVIEKPTANLTMQTRSIPTPGPNEIVIRNHAIASNPVDWKIQAYALSFVSQYPTILGVDISGTIHSLGSSVSPQKFSIGDRVLGYAGIIGTSGDPDYGGFQTYTLVKEILVTKIPKGMGFEEGVVLPLAMATSAHALFVNLGVARPPISVNGKEGILIWGAASSVGTAAIQIMKICGYKIFATASPANHAYLKSLGATEVFDYRDSNVVSKIAASAKAAGITLKLAYDTITEGTTMKMSAEVLLASGAGKGEGKLTLVMPWPEEVQKVDGVEVSMAFAAVLGGECAELGAWFFGEWLEGVLERGEVVAAPRPEIVGEGIEATQKMLDLHKAGVSNKKLVVKIA